METIGFVGVGKIGMPISENLIKSGHRVVGFRRSSLAEFEKIGGVPVHSAAEVGAQADIVLSCLPSTEALDEVVHGPQGLMHSARPGQIVVELGSHPVPDKARQIAPLKEKGAIFIDGEVSGTPGMVSARKGVIYLAGDADGLQEGRTVVAGFADSCLYFGEFGAASRVKLINNLLVAINIAATAEAMALGLKAGVDVPSDDQGDRDRLGRLDPVRHPRAMDGGAPLQAAAGHHPGPAALCRHDRAISPTTSAWPRRCWIASPNCSTASWHGARRQRRRRHDRRHRLDCRDSQNNARRQSKTKGEIA